MVLGQGDEATTDGEVEEENVIIDSETGLEALLTPEGILNFTSGIVYGTGLVENEKYLDICTKMLEVDFVARSRQVYNTTLEKQIFPSLYGLYDIVWSIHPLFINCYKAPDTASDIILARFDDQYDIKVILTNIVHNVSFAVDTYLDV